ncbi:UDP-N-acetylmuramoyl-L-alanyl-D-glutamate--2,6-diaminopimelate ligase [Hydrogenoanaerobacterium saccharovorans]|uniref:UDP-N-acetylmuramoyl-L-alanyl-D-glutamate--2,6-diaminopimelate ligase n=1 Tax=Hydrogenoanaerobacterium saccharovorans TaxID=474960 RepID=A0ABS2GI78_9FIRM|nr:UDP-N-acetylmuramoyl-L-alanyl-D-glutamate--2,6-diaminopimelate ligase [Hydrogenoanaerobacterium saccharovorans]MBM6922185.1 UDP-N-acetylmuramoyl-L-alanyl-D-glutamate--2,6-diaminopimelate ligase [Hydrogenoanaerobacterium saccharovorans]MBS5634394.1 UDP-N-acetylmuramoyl-L-alanyl-D-glutamate--2,6-diaminopimelate ligase [Clostridiales bacterium]HIY80767.1 UDP-N-acetylmuramoyl-L-alanyl-D-glutamate--2,6-diaminopimelate ligase [Bacillota bacterium]
MLLTKLLEGITWEGEAPECEIVGLTADSRQLEPGWVYVCQKGQRFDGHDFAAKALELGAAAVVVDRDLGLPRQIRVEDTHAAYPLLCANFFGRPADSMKMIGVTGTNGKTTSVFLIKHLLTAAGHRTGLIGTVQNEIGDLVLPAKFTTPDPYQLQSMLAKMRAAGCEYVAMEVSSHALDQHRADGIHFDVAVFTNLTLDHLDYHHTMEEYFAAKRKLFDRCDTAVLNIDDEHGRILAEELSCRTVTISDKDDTADYLAGNIRIRSDGSSFVVLHGGELEKVNISTPGDFSIHNALGALAAVTEAGVPMAQAAADLADCAGVPGRFEVVPNALGFTVIRDYAHTPDGIDNVLSTVRGITDDRMVVLFGCPGLRDSSKRPAMAAAVAKYADFVILTSDNPREEPEEKIINDALPGLTASGKPYKIISDRYEAIEYALETCGEGDILLLLGKGHEDYQVLASGANYFNEKEIVGELSRKIARQRTEGSEK